MVMLEIRLKILIIHSINTISISFNNKEDASKNDTSSNPATGIVITDGDTSGLRSYLQHV